MSITVVATIRPRAEHRAEVVAAFEKATARVHAEDEGCELYAMHDALDGSIVMVEKWTSTDALTAHSGSPALQELNGAIGDLLESPADVVVLQPHPAGDHRGVV